MGALHGNLALYGLKRCGFVPAFESVYAGYTINGGLMGWPTPDLSDKSLRNFHRGNLASWRAYIAFQVSFGHLIGWQMVEDLIFILSNSKVSLAYLQQAARLFLEHPEFMFHGRLMRPPTFEVPLPVVTMTGNNPTPNYQPCIVPAVATSIFEAANGSQALVVVNHAPSAIIVVVAASHEYPRLNMSVAPLSAHLYLQHRTRLKNDDALCCAQC